MADPLNTAVSGLLSYQRALATVGHNIANVNTEGYSRQRVELATNPADAFGAGYIGTGVRTTDVSRIYDQFLVQHVRSSAASFNQLDAFAGLAGQVDNLLADPNVGLAPSLERFFNSVQEVSDFPASIPTRQVMLSEAGSLVNNFQIFEQRFRDLDQQVNSQIETIVAEIDSIADEIASLNSEIALQTGGDLINNAPNDLLDRRDLLIKQLSERIGVTTTLQDNGAVNVFIGNGQSLVVGTTRQRLVTTLNPFNASRLEVAQTIGTNTATLSDFLSGGTLGGLLGFRKQVLDAAENAVNRIAVGLGTDFNTQHRLGQDLNGTLGENFFTVPAPQISASTNNAVATGISATVTDVNQLIDSDYQLTYNGSDIYTLTRVSDGTEFLLDATGGYPFTSSAIDGFTVGIAAAPGVNDSFLIQPTGGGLSGFALAISQAEKIAAAVPVRTTASLNNTGDGTISSGLVTDRTLYSSDSYTVVLADQTAAAGGAIAFTDNIGTDDTLQYELRINGFLVNTYNEGDSRTLTQLAADINADVANTGVRAYLNSGSTTLYLANDPPTALPITVNETLTGATDGAADQVVGLFGSNLTGAAATNTLTYSSPADSYIIVDSGSNVDASGAYTSGNNIDFNGIRIALSGSNNLGDTFTISPNTSGVSDNRNALALIGLQTRKNLNNGNASFQGAYGQLVASVGTRTRQAEISRDAQETVLNQAIDAQQAASGVNLEEEAANLVRFQQAFQAMSQVIATTDELFQTLINAVRR